jgi:hypothetical protein
MEKSRVLDEQQTLALLCDVINGDVRRFGIYKCGPYIITVAEAETWLDKEVVKEQRKDRYHILKSKGICVQCGRRKASKRGTVTCDPCRRRHNQWRKN